jgi:hypothetical protein
MFAMTAAGFEAMAFQSMGQFTHGNTLQNICASHVDAADPLVQ